MRPQSSFSHLLTRQHLALASTIRDPPPRFFADLHFIASSNLGSSQTRETRALVRESLDRETKTCGERGASWVIVHIPEIVFQKPGFDGAVVTQDWISGRLHLRSVFPVSTGHGG